MKVYKLYEASEKKIKYINRHPDLDDEQKEEIIDLYIKQNIPDNLIDWNVFNSYSFEDLKEIAETYLKNREDKKNKKNLSRALEGRDYIKVFENTNEEGTEYLYLPLTWIGSKYLASDHFLPKIKVPSKVMEARDFSDNSAENEDLSPGAKWCISLWTIPDLVIDGKPLTDLNGREFRHEGKRYWLNYTSKGYYFLFYFRDYNNLDDINKKIALTLRKYSFRVEDVTLADDTSGERDSVIERVWEYWSKHYDEYESQIEHLIEVSREDRPKFSEYERQKEEKAREYYKSHKKEYTLKKYFTYNESTGRYDSENDCGYYLLSCLLKDGEFTVPLGIINGDFDCSNLELRTLENGPNKVTGKFNCSHNNLTSLEYAPEYVGGNFRCSYNNLTTLEGAPQKVGKDFDCSSNKLTSLEYAPQEVGGDFDCSVNNLTSLEYAPQKVKEGFYCGNNKLTSLKGSPKELGWSFDCSNNKLTSLEGSPNYVGGFFYCGNNRLKTLEGAPQEVKVDFICGNNPLQSKELSTNVKGDVYY